MVCSQNKKKLIFLVLLIKQFLLVFSSTCISSQARLVKLNEYLWPLNFLLKIYFLCIFSRKIYNSLNSLHGLRYNTFIGMVQKQNNFAYQLSKLLWFSILLPKSVLINLDLAQIQTERLSKDCNTCTCSSTRSLHFLK